MKKDALNLDRNQLIVRISFGKSSSQYFNDAIQIARELPNYESIGEGLQQQHIVKVLLSVEDPQLWDRVRSLARIAGHWKRSQVEIQGVSVDSFSELERGISAIRNCYQGLNESGLGEIYCSGKDAPDCEKSCFGCRFVKGVTPENHGNYWQPLHSSWYQFGDLDDDLTTFTVDKDEIFRICKIRTKGRICTTCPEFSWKRVKKDIDELPNAINLDESSVFEVKYSEIDPSKILGIKIRESKNKIGVGLGYGMDESGNVSLERNIPSVRYSDIAAQDNALEEIKNIVQLPLVQREYFEQLGIEPQRGVILYGPPGNGKTLLAKAVASESNAHLEIINGPEILSMWHGQSEENLRNIFKRAKELEPSIILIYEVDSISPNRNKIIHQHEISLISQFLVLLDGLETRGKVIVVATTNRIEAVDPAIRRPGRFDYHINVPFPEEGGRKAILRVHLRNLKTDSRLNLDEIAKQTDGSSGAELASLCREAGLAAIHRAIDKKIEPKNVSIHQEDLNLALIKIKHKHYRLSDSPEEE